MPPKFQSSFIPKGPLASGAMPTPVSSSYRQHDLTSVLAKTVFAISFLAALLATGYKFYLNYSIKDMAVEIAEARESLTQEGAVAELIALNTRISSASELVSGHRVASPLFAFFEENTPRSVQITEFDFEFGKMGPTLAIVGVAQSYSALALQADLIYKSANFINPVFSEIRLNDRGNVTFTMKADVNPELLSYEQEIARSTTPAVAPTATSTRATLTATSTATSTATTTAPRAGTNPTGITN